MSFEPSRWSFIQADVKLVHTFVLLVFGASLAFAQSDDSAARRLLHRANQARARAGAGALVWDDKLAAIALSHAQMMAARKQLSHQFPGEPAVRQRVISTGLRTTASGENVAFAGEPDELFQGWMDSPGHRANLLNDKYNATGIAVVRRGDTIYAVQDFARRLDAYTDREVEKIIATHLIRVRALSNLPEAKPLPVPDVHPAACDMARDGQMEAAALTHKLPKVRAVFTFTTAEPQKLPERLSSFAPDARSFAVGSCFARDERFPEGTNWVVVAFY